jgi:probable HAF family extracellular repeat protein
MNCYKGLLVAAVTIVMGNSFPALAYDYTVTELKALGVWADSGAYDINNSGQIVGWSDWTTTERHGPRAVMWDSSGNVTDVSRLVRNSERLV